MPRLIIPLLLIILMAPAVCPARAAAYQYDLGIEQSGIFFSKSRLIAGEHIRIYGRIKNHGSEDASAYVTFYKSNELIGDSQVVTVRAGGLDDEVYVDFTVPGGSFNIRAEIRGQDPGDENPANDVAVTTLFFPESDDDGDGIPNDEDNCPQTANADQADSDKDGLGNACDSDDDNDGWDDSREQQEGTSPTSADTDGDGTNDPADKYPLDPKLQDTPPVVPETTSEIIPPAPAAESPAKETATEESVGAEEEISAAEEASSTPELTVEQASGLANLQISPHAAFSFKRITWNQYEFQALGALRKNYRYEWDFGDGDTSNQEKVVHSFKKSGSYVVTLKVIDLIGNIAQDEIEVSISFFNFENWKLKVLLALILAGTVAVLIILGRLSQKKLEENKK